MPFENKSLLTLRGRLFSKSRSQDNKSLVTTNLEFKAVHNQEPLFL